MGFYTSIVAVLAIIYGIIITIVSLNLGSRMADTETKCNKDAIKSNQGLLVVGGVMMAFGISYLSCNFMCECRGGKSDYMLDNSIVFSAGTIIVSIICITLSAVIENTGRSCIHDINRTTMSVWIPGIIILMAGLTLLGLHLWVGGGLHRGRFVTL